MQLEALAHHQPEAGRPYPVRWRLRLPASELELEVAAVMDEQLHRGRFRYWEGAVDVTGRGPGGPVSGRGYLEMTPY